MGNYYTDVISRTRNIKQSLSSQKGLLDYWKKSKKLKTKKEVFLLIDLMYSRLRRQRLARNKQRLSQK